MLAGTSSDYYTRMERGHLGGVSLEVLEAVARALQLDEAETEHLHNLARAANPSTVRRRPKAPDSAVRPSLQRFLDTITGTPTWVRNRQMDIVATNPLGRALLAPVLDDPASRGNNALFTFLNPAARIYYPAWTRARAVSSRPFTRRPAKTRTTRRSPASSANSSPAPTTSVFAGPLTTSATTAPAPNTSIIPRSVTSSSPTKPSTCPTAPAGACTRVPPPPAPPPRNASPSSGALPLPRPPPRSTAVPYRPPDPEDLLRPSSSRAMTPRGSPLRPREERTSSRRSLCAPASAAGASTASPASAPPRAKPRTELPATVHFSSAESVQNSSVVDTPGRSEPRSGRLLRLDHHGNRRLRTPIRRRSGGTHAELPVLNGRQKRTRGNFSFRLKEGYSRDGVAAVEYTYNGLRWFWTPETPRGRINSYRGVRLVSDDLLGGCSAADRFDRS